MGTFWEMEALERHGSQSCGIDCGGWSDGIWLFNADEIGQSGLNYLLNTGGAGDRGTSIGFGCRAEQSVR